MAEEHSRQAPGAQAEERISRILHCADQWSSDVPEALRPSIRAVCVRLAEMVADQRNYLAPLPADQESERAEMLQHIADRLRSSAVTAGIETHLADLAELELRSTGSWSLVSGAQNQWIETAIRYLEVAGEQLPADERPEPYWADDVVAGIIAFTRDAIGVDELQARTEARYSGGIPRPQLPPED
ncbi:MAG TPA: hypothetical protein VFS94_05760 [Gemmatimonadales bacterium]|nr:hypothetical protein [Gemmatimonadales bacterium]